MTGPFLSTAPASQPGQPNRQARTLRLDSPAGPLILRESQEAITALHWLKSRQPSGESTVPGVPGVPDPSTGSPLLAEAARQLKAYFAGERREFDLPLAPAGSSFHKDVWRLMCAIPFGQTATYGDLARRLDSAAQPVGSACGANPIAILIPCHRVVAADGLGGFSGGVGVESKRFLLHHEGALEPELDLF
jgi:methylated-DNA-[protein]-cysteine S-methyltransferase